MMAIPIPIAKLLAKYAKKLGVGHLVQGHQPGKVQFPDKETERSTLSSSVTGCCF